MSEESVEAYVRCVASLLRLDLDAASFEAVMANTRIFQAFQSQIMNLELPDDLDPAAMLRL